MSTRAEGWSIGEIAQWYNSLEDRWPDIFQGESLDQYWNWSKQIWYASAGGKKDQAVFVRSLRAGALKIMRKAVNKCERCPLSMYRMSGRGVLEDGSYMADPFVQFGDKQALVGATSAEIMLVSESPGNFEARIGNPFTSYQVLAGSVCAYECREYENCYNGSSKFPCQPCKPVSLRSSHPENEVIQIRMERANAVKFPIQTVAGILDTILIKTGLWREAWNGRQVLLEDTNEVNAPRPGSVYLTNVNKCRSCKPKDNGGLEDTAPSKEEMGACSPYLEAQIHIIQPKVIVAIGNPAITGLLGIEKPKVLENRGNAYPSKYNIPVLVECHPSFIARLTDDKERENYISHFVETMKKAKEVVEGSLTFPWMITKPISTTGNDYPDLSGISFISTFPKGD